jgi:TolA-binding protein
MLRLRFSSGLLLGLVVGVLAGVVIGMLMLPARSIDAGAATNAQVIELTRRLEAATDAKERADRQLEQFQKLADQMTATFKSLEQRFNALEEAQRLREGQRPPAGQPEAKAPAPQPTAPAPLAGATPTAAPTTSNAAPPATDEGRPDDSSDTG